MECNKDEAIRAKELAENKMRNDDFEVARKFAQKAQRLFPELENISQLLMVCDVHCSARNKICGLEMDWYGVLQVEKIADEVAIKKQYRKLALVLHPDKNKFPGAEAAFKLIGEANMVLSDKVKRAMYDNKCRVAMRHGARNPPPATKTPAQQLNRNCPNRKHVPTQPSQSNGVRQTFWTNCPFCGTRYQYYIEYMNGTLHCQNCAKLFIAHDLGAPSYPPMPTHVQPDFPRQNQVPGQGSFKVESQGIGSFTHSHMKFQGGFNFKTGSTTEVGGGFATRVKDGNEKKGGKEEVGSAKVAAVNLEEMEEEEQRNTKRKREWKLEQDSSESSETATSTSFDEPEITQEKNVGSSAGQNSGLSGVRRTQRSLRKRQHVSYNESLSDDDDFVSPPKKSNKNNTSLDSKEELNGGAFKTKTTRTDNSTGFAAAVKRGKEDNKQKEKGHPVRSGEDVAHKVNGEEVKATDCNPKKSEVIYNSGSNSDSSVAPDPQYFQSPDAEFNDFDKAKEDGCFAVDQIWACYDPEDCMPRYYARVRKVFASEFRLRITWLEPSPKSQDEIRWLSEGLPIACGKFVHGESLETMDRLTFSHQVHYGKGNSRCSYSIYPRKGETWALFKDWDISWNSYGENVSRGYGYEVVEIISDFNPAVGIKVAFLEKVQGFVSVFQQTSSKGIMTSVIPPTELLRFSHQIPSFKLIGTEREGVPKGSFELDPASAPPHFYKSGSMKIETEKSGGVNDSDPKSPEKDVKSRKPEKLSTPKKGVGLEGKNDLVETFKLRRSPREAEKLSNPKNGVGVEGKKGLEETFKLRRSPREVEMLSTPKKGLEETFKLRRSTREVEMLTTPKKGVGLEGKNDLGETFKLQRSPREAEKLSTPKKGVGLEGKDDLEETFKLRRSPRGLNNGDKHSPMKASQDPIPNGVKDKKNGNFTPSKGVTLSQSDGKMNASMEHVSLQSSTRSPSISQSFSPGKKISIELHNFNEQKSEGNFQPGQIWALYSNRDKLPKRYAMVRKIESSPFQLYVSMLKACTVSKCKVRAVCCGTFQTKTGKPSVVSRTFFSHHVDAVFLGETQLKIYPMVGQVWALYKDWNANMLNSDTKKCKYEIVEVIEGNQSCVKVSPLFLQKGWESIFMPLRRQRSSSRVMEIPQEEWARFSHQIPAIRLTEEKHGHLRGCWELDPASIPGNLS